MMAVQFKVFMVVLLVFSLSTLFILGSVEGLENSKYPSNLKQVDANQELALDDLLKSDYTPPRPHPPPSLPLDAKKELAFDVLLESDYTPPRHHPPRSPPLDAKKELAFDELMNSDYTPPRHRPPLSPPASVGV